ncbi:uncharacterized protein LOC107883267 [Acyrthosiphon pisum]|uniref:Integrase catalytic domain-containing protein n=1 Tax=Acyrthosiphon pisum TaxID=7029 RepID=A0A8R2H781_ACYPI|nr:uncharacterized protein LOC107883267 [Acyrthosiphon pisum]|eukprot:XP_016658419.1 PREDICTED: uncharacterized protein LOC107883267 [Acyrthosiphon pisum]
MIPLSKENNGYNYILCVLDCFTKFAWTIPLKIQIAEEVTKAMSTILIDRSPKLLQYKIKKYSTYSTTKACFVERFNRTLKTNMYREFTARGSHKRIDILPMLIDNYNSTRHRTIGMTPLQAEESPSLVTLKQRAIANTKVKFCVGDKVRISTHR